MAKAEDHNHHDPERHLPLEKDDAQHGRQKPEGAGSGQQAVEEPHEESPSETRKVPAEESAVVHVAASHDKHGTQARREKHEARKRVNKARHVAEHAPGRRAHAAHAEHRREEPSAEADGVASRPARLRGHGLARHVADEKRDGRQVTGAQERAHNAPGEAPQHGQPELVLDEVVDSDEQVFEHGYSASRPSRMRFISPSFR